jgi:hypothetical protein
MRRSFQRNALGPLRARLASILEGLAYARSRPELVGSFAVEIVAAGLARPMAFGALLLIVFSGWTARVDRRGAAEVRAAMVSGWRCRRAAR